ncbi:MAG: Fic family protein [Crenarchaeota archaeon]|nr:Fic family protein [Thermoproteota archaeon]
MYSIDKIKITPEMLSIIAEIDEFKGSWKVLGKIAPERLQSLKKVATIESIGSSNRIEGNKLSDKQVEELLSRINRKSFASRDEEEVAGYANIMDTVFENWEVMPFTENYIKQFHKTLLQYSSKDEKHRGEYKKLPNNVVAYDPEGKEIGVVFETASPFDTPLQMKELVNKTDELLQDRFLHPLITIGMFIVHFLAIHPFQDGNGRLSRVLTTLLLLKTGYSYVPYSSMEAIIEDNKEGYYRALRQTQMTLTTSPDYEHWLMFYLRTMQKQKLRLEHKVGTDIAKMTYLPELSAKIMEIAKGQERITISEVIEKTGANPNTVKKHLAELVSDGYLVKHGKTRGAWYTVI